MLRVGQKMRRRKRYFELQVENTELRPEMGCEYGTTTACGARNLVSREYVRCPTKMLHEEIKKHVKLNAIIGKCVKSRSRSIRSKRRLKNVKRTRVI